VLLAIVKPFNSQVSDDLPLHVLDIRLIIFSQTGKRIFLGSSAWIDKPPHVHRISSETLDVYPMIVENVSIESIVEPTLEVSLIFEILLKHLN
jgi:hypothetical protein